MNAVGLAISRETIVRFLSRYAIWGEGAEHWHLRAEIDWRELRRVRKRQLAYVGRYGRQDMLAWRHVPVTLLTETVAALSEVVRDENDLQSVQEDR